MLPFLLNKIINPCDLICGQEMFEFERSCLSRAVVLLGFLKIMMEKCCDFVALQVQRYELDKMLCFCYA